MFLHREGLTSDGRDFLDEAHHGLIAVSVELVVVTCLQRYEFFLSILGGVLGNLWLHCVFEVRQEAQAIVKFYFIRLVIYCAPCSWHLLALTFATILTEDGLSLELVHELDSPDIFSVELPVMII